MIRKEQYLQAKKTIADYELQEWLFGNSGLLDPDSGKTLTNVGGLWWETEPARGKSIVEEAKEKGYKEGAVVVLNDIEFNLVGDPYVFRGELMCDTGRGNFKLLIHNPATGFWAPIKKPAQEDPKSPLQEAMDRGYRKGAVVKTAGVSYYLMLTEDPWLAEDGRVVCRAQPDFSVVNTLVTIWDKEKEYQSLLILKAPEDMLKEVIDNGYRAGRTINAYGEKYRILFDPVLSGKMVIAAVQGSKDTFKFDIPIWMDGVGYLFELETEAPESPVNNK